MSPPSSFPSPKRWKHQALECADIIASQPPKETWPIIAGMAAFGSTLAMATFSQLKVLGISTGTRPPFVPSVLGIASVCAASLASHGAAMKAHSCLEDYKRQRHLELGSKQPSFLATIIESPIIPNNLRQQCFPSTSPSSKSLGVPSKKTILKEHINPAGLIQIPMHTLRICVVGLLAYKICGGRFWAIAPSSYTNLGSFARASLPATERYASASQRKAIERMGRLTGCHTCGSRRLLTSFTNKLPKITNSATSLFVGDHMPPKAVAKQINSQWFNRLVGKEAKFRFYPQCTPCSNRQGSILSAAVQQQQQTRKNVLAKAGGGRRAHFHGLRPRISHVVAGGLVASVTVAGASDADIVVGNPQRLYRWQKQFEDCCGGFDGSTVTRLQRYIGGLIGR